MKAPWHGLRDTRQSPSGDVDPSLLERESSRTRPFPLVQLAAPATRKKLDPLPQNIFGRSLIDGARNFLLMAPLAPLDPAIYYN